MTHRAPCGARADAPGTRLAGLGYGDRVEVRVGDGSLGLPAEAPWRGIIVAAAAPEVPEALRSQLDPDGGRLVLPVGDRQRQELVVVTRQGEDVDRDAATGRWCSCR